MIDSFTQSLDAFIDVAREFNDFERFIPNLESFRNQLASKCLKSYTANRNGIGYNVLNHADFHLKNMMFKTNDEGAIDDFYFVSFSLVNTQTENELKYSQIDYQICNYATPAIDLIYALYFLVSTENRKHYRAELISIYHKQFVDSLKEFGYLKTPPTLIDLQVELMRNGHLEVVISICMSIVLYLDFSTFSAEDIDMGEGTKRARRRMYQIPGFKEIILAELPRMLHNGFI